MSVPVDPEFFEPGLHVRVDPDPIRRAGQVADRIHGELCATQQQVQAVLAALGEHPPVTAEDLARLRDLNDRVAAAGRIVDRTVGRAAVEVGERLASVGSGVAIHPSAVRDRAASVVAARDALFLATERLENGHSEADARAAALSEIEPLPPLSMPSQVASFVDEPPARHRRFFGRKRRARAYEEDTTESTSLLQQVATTTDDAFGARRANEARNDHLLILRAQRDRAEEDLRVAERAWSDLAGDETVENVETVVLRFDPQHKDALAVAHETVGVRAASTLLERVIERLEDGLRSLGFEPPVPLHNGWFERMADRMERPLVLVADAVEQAELIAKAAPAAPVVVFETAS